MKDQQLDVLRGSDNVYRDLGQDNADVQQFKALLAAEIIKIGRRDRALSTEANGRESSKAEVARASRTNPR